MDIGGPRGGDETRPLHDGLGPEARAVRAGAPPIHPRYEIRGVLGGGGQGVVFRAFDRDLRREVALKTLRPGDASDREATAFADEAGAAARLEHPNIVPIHDFGLLSDRRPFYTMRLVSGRSLASVLDAVEADLASGGDAADEWSVTRLAQVVQQVAAALQCAHEHGIVHRDVKPANVMLGSLGEVLVVDWGIAKYQRPSGLDTATGIVRGTLHYLSPEQARGDDVDHRTDIHSLGVVLFECLTFRHPFAGESTAERLASILRDAPQPPSRLAPAGRAIPPELSELALRALAKRPADRPQTAREFGEEIQAFLEGVRDRERREAEAAAHRARARESEERHVALAAELVATREEIARLELAHPPWQPVVEKRPLHAARARAEALDDQAREAFLEAVNGYTDALAHVSDDAQARAALAALFWTRFERAESAGDRALAQTFRRLVERFHDGRLARELQGDGELNLAVTPESAELTLHSLVEEDLVLVDGPGRPLGRGSVRGLALPMGSYVIVARAEGYETARQPVAIARCEAWTGELELLPAGSVPDGFVHVPALRSWVGGDPMAQNSWPRRRVEIPPVLVGRHPVSFAQYCGFLDALGRDGALPYVPTTETTGALCRWNDQLGRWEPDLQRYLSPWIEARFGRDRLGDLPTFGIDRECADAYCRWLGERHGKRCALPTSEQWEAVARGADGRLHPWGNRFDAALCHVRDSVPQQPDMAVVGSVPTDRSVHGVQDLAGTIQEWTSSWHDEARQLVEARGGGWTVSLQACRSAWRGAAVATTRSVHLGFRCTLQP